MNSIINFSDFHKVDIRLGTIIEAYSNDKLRNPSIILKIDFGVDIGIKKSSAQIKKNYNEFDLIGKQIIAVINFQPKQIGNILSEVLVLGLPDKDNEPILLTPPKKMKNGIRLY